MTAALNGVNYFDTDRQASTLFSWTAGKPTPDDIACEKSRLEALYECELIIHHVDHPVIQGKKYTRVTWAEKV